MKPFIRSPYNYDSAVVTRALATKTGNDGLTKQADAQDADINVLVKRFGITGTLPAVPVPPTYQQFSEVFDFQSAMNVIRDATEAFNALPSDVRKRFNNDPGAFVDFCSETADDGKSLANLAEMRKMGLALPPEPEPLPPAPMKVEVVNNVPRETPKE